MVKHGYTHIISQGNAYCMPFERSKGKVFENGRR